ncbi:hypothetical protein GTP38_19465 [Duganella sp. FT94W]|uniref:DUF3426 domain-containing protein n=1 Tax=Duganella lactea TaxID=2692173 RepID=A0ABW9VBZ0_9BURK|nr:hypothetical protein [Duganella lactea]MYM36511.1 hypothetical protein [Duganella lactea]
MDPDHSNGDELDTSHPWLVIPYFHGDEGRAAQRPLTKLTPPVTSWLCPSIRVQGVNYTTPAGTYLPDEPLAITVEVDNRGVPNVRAKVQVYWSDPATGFASRQMIFTASKPVPGRAAAPTRLPPMIWTPEQASIPEHFCLLVHVSCTPPEPDPGPLAPSPLTDRHWAQYNLTSAMLTAAGSGNFVFWAGNPAPEQAAYLVAVRPLGEEALRKLARVVRAEPVPTRPRQLSLYRAVDAARRESHEASVVVALERGQRQALVLSAHDLQLAPQQFTAVEVMQTRVGQERAGDATGSLGVVLFGHTAETRRRRGR